MGNETNDDNEMSESAEEAPDSHDSDTEYYFAEESETDDESESEEVSEESDSEPELRPVPQVDPGESLHNVEVGDEITEELTGTVWTVSEVTDTGRVEVVQDSDTCSLSGTEKGHVDEWCHNEVVESAERGEIVFAGRELGDVLPHMTMISTNEDSNEEGS